MVGVRYGPGAWWARRLSATSRPAPEFLAGPRALLEASAGFHCVGVRRVRSDKVKVFAGLERQIPAGVAAAEVISIDKDPRAIAQYVWAGRC